MRTWNWIPSIPFDIEPGLLIGTLLNLEGKRLDLARGKWEIVLGTWWADAEDVEELSAE